jgi:hypothetical protein
MADNNFKQWDEAVDNIMTDAEYLINSQRTDGAPQGQLFPSNLANKLYFQMSTFIAAFAAMMQSKGYDMLDTDIVVLQNALMSVLTQPEMVAYAAKINGDVNNVFNVATSTVPGNAVNNTRLTGYAAKINGDAAQVFNAYPGLSGNQVVNISQFVRYISGIGYQKLPGGIIIQWGQVAALGAGEIRGVAFPLYFPNALLEEFVSPDVTSYGGVMDPAVSVASAHEYGYPNQGALAIYRMDSNAPTAVNWFAIGC